MIKVSIIVPVYNVSMYLKECLDSIINQTLKEIEIICVNDGSTDNSLEILKEYADKDSRIKVIDKQNTGYGNTMNVGIDCARGSYIGIVEPDDYVKPEMYKTLYEIAVHYDLDLIKADFYRFTGQGKNLHLEYNQLSSDKKYYGKVLNPEKNIEVFKFIMNTWSGIYKKDFLNKFHIRHNETPGASFQDNGFWFQTFCRASKIFFVNEPFYMNRRDNPGSSVHSRDKVYCASVEYQYIKQFLENNPELKDIYIYIYSLKKYHNFQFTLRRIGEEYRLEFLQHFSNEFSEAKKNGELDKKLFTPYEWKTLNRIIDDPKRYYHDCKKGKIKGKSLIMKTVESLRSNGIMYTARKIKDKLKGV